MAHNSLPLAIILTIRITVLGFTQTVSHTYTITAIAMLVLASPNGF